MAGYEILDIGASDTWAQYTGGRSVGKRFVEKELPIEYFGISANGAEPGTASAYWHTHDTLEEVYVFLAGRGQMALGDDVVEVGPGSIVRVDQGTQRAWHAAADSDVPLQFLCIRGGGAKLAEIGHDGSADRETPLPWA